MVAFSSLTIAVFMLFYPVPNSWTALVIESVLSTMVLLGGYLLLGIKIRTAAREEIEMTLRILRLV
jgi:hypothetical protein